MLRGGLKYIADFLGIINQLLSQPGERLSGS